MVEVEDAARDASEDMTPGPRNCMRPGPCGYYGSPELAPRTYFYEEGRLVSVVSEARDGYPPVILKYEYENGRLARRIGPFWDGRCEYVDDRLHRVLYMEPGGLELLNVDYFRYDEMGHVSAVERYLAEGRRGLIKHILYVQGLPSEVLYDDDADGEVETRSVATWDEFGNLQKWESHQARFPGEAPDVVLFDYDCWTGENDICLECDGRECDRRFLSVVY
jgi:hypothetical protein